MQPVVAASSSDTPEPRTSTLGTGTSGLGLHDMSGNVFEWIGAYYQFYPDPDSQAVWSDFEISDMRILRGGSFRNAPEHAQTFWRSGTLRGVRSEMIGFRCAADAE